METKNLTCINCPMGCYLTVKIENGQVVEVLGESCARGVAYAKTESLNPKRMMTSTVRLHGAILDVLPVKSAQPVPKSMVPVCVIALKGVDIDAPVKMGDVIVSNVAGTGVDVIATRSFERGVRH